MKSNKLKCVVSHVQNDEKALHCDCEASADDCTCRSKGAKIENWLRNSSGTNKMADKAIESRERRRVRERTNNGGKDEEGIEIAFVWIR
jgi:hypothetical protein